MEFSVRNLVDQTLAFRKTLGRENTGKPLTVRISFHHLLRWAHLSFLLFPEQWLFHPLQRGCGVGGELWALSWMPAHWVLTILLWPPFLQLLCGSQFSFYHLSLSSCLPHLACHHTLVLLLPRAMTFLTVLLLSQLKCYPVPYWQGPTLNAVLIGSPLIPIRSLFVMVPVS